MKIIAHGGYSAKYKENTIESFKAATKFNPFAIEMDLIFDSLTKDFYVHRPQGVSDTKGTFSDYTLSHEDAQLFTHVIKEINWNGNILFDLKNPSIEAVDNILALPKEILRRIILGVRDIGLLERLQNSKNIPIQTLGLISDLSQMKDFKSLNCTYIRLWEKDLTDMPLAESFPNTNIWVTPGTKVPRTAGDTTLEKLKWFRSLGVDGVLLNDLELAKEIATIS